MVCNHFAAQMIATAWIGPDVVDGLTRGAAGQHTCVQSSIHAGPGLA
jgi:hypothetical protein